MQHGVGGAAHRDVELHRIGERRLRRDGLRQDGLVVVLVVGLDDLDDQPARFLEQALSRAVGGERRTVAGQRQADGFEETVHRVRGEHS